MAAKRLVANLEAYDSASPDAVAELANLDLNGTQLLNTVAVLESATIALESAVEVADTLSTSVEENALQDILGPVAINAIADVDSTSAEEAQIALESDDKTFWVKLKEKIRQLWETIVSYVSKFWEWLKSFFSKSKAANESNKKSLDEEVNKIIAMSEASTSTPASSGKSANDASTAGSDTKMPYAESFKRDIVIEATPTWAMQNEGWKASDVIRRIDHYCKEIVPHAKATAAQMKEITRLSKFNLSQIKKRVSGKSNEDIVRGWQDAAEAAKDNYMGESKFINGTPILIGFTRGAGGYRPCDSASGDVVFRNVGEIKALSDRLKAYGDASVKAIGELAGVDADISQLMREAETFVKELPTEESVDETTLNKIMPLMRQVMFRQIDMMREYTSSHGFKSQANGVRLLRAVRLQLQIAK